MAWTKKTKPAIPTYSKDSIPSSIRGITIDDLTKFASTIDELSNWKATIDDMSGTISIFNRTKKPN